MRRLAFLIVLVGALAGAPMPSAQAQSTVGPSAGPASAASSNNASTGGNDSAAGIAAEQGQAVNPVGTPGTLPVANGVALTFTYIGEAAGNPTGGIKQGAAYSDQIFGGLDFDLKTIVGLDGGFVHFAMVERNGKSDSASFIGNDTAVQEIYGQQKLRLTLFTYQQKFLDGKIDITLGRSGGNDDFLTSPLYCLFESNAICGSPVYIFQTTNFTAFPASGYAGIGKVFLTDKVYLHVGAYAADPENTAPTEIGYNLGVETATGATIPAEIVYATSFKNDRLPRHYAIGAIYDASKRADPLLGANGLPAAVTGQAYRQDFGRSVAYASFDQMIRRPDDSKPTGLSIFGAGFLSTSGRQSQDHSFELGLVQLGTLTGRDRDTIGFAVNEKRYSSAFIDNILVQRVPAGGSLYVPREQVMFELNYGYEVNDVVRLTPNLQYVLNPDQGSEPTRTTNIPNAFVIGGRITADLSAIIPQSLFR